MDKERFAKIMYRLAELFGVKPSKDQLKFLYEMFVDDGFDIHRVEKAAINIIKTKKDGYGRMPTYAEFLDEIRLPAERLAEIEANNVIAAIRNHGAYNKPDLGQAVNEIIEQRFGGWRNLCGTLEDSKLQWFIRDFKEAYLSWGSKNKMLPNRQESENILKQIGGDVLKTMAQEK